jgi:hypothetical protein
MNPDRLDEIVNFASYALGRGWVTPRAQLAEAVPELLDEVKRLQAENAKLRAKIPVD